jgi:hypothetical protein
MVGKGCNNDLVSPVVGLTVEGTENGSGSCGQPWPPAVVAQQLWPQWLWPQQSQHGTSSLTLAVMAPPAAQTGEHAYSTLIMNQTFQYKAPGQAERTENLVPWEGMLRAMGEV